MFALTSCGGPNLAYWAYHGNFSHGSSDVKTLPCRILAVEVAGTQGLTQRRTLSTLSRTRHARLLLTRTALRGGVVAAMRLMTSARGVRRRSLTHQPARTRTALHSPISTSGQML